MARSLSSSLGLALSCVAMLVGAPSLGAEPDRYAGRDGAAEARLDLNTIGTSLKLYAHVANGRIPLTAVPGILHCDVLYALPAGITFIVMPEAEWREGVIYSDEQLDRAASAVRFAKAYNRTIFALREEEVRRACRDATLSK